MHANFDITTAPRYHFVRKSGNSKTGPIPVTTTGAQSCPTACPFRTDRDGGCYAGGGPLAMHWRKLSNGERGYGLDELCADIRTLPRGQTWRHNQAGDLPHTGDGETVDAAAVAQIAEANADAGADGFTYSHHRVTGDDTIARGNRTAIANANARGFTVNLSANTLAHADALADTGAGPVVVVLSGDVHGNQKLATPKGRKVVVCPATYRDDVSCATCKLCASRSPKRPIVGFPAHGASAKRASAVAVSLS